MLSYSIASPARAVGFYLKPRSAAPTHSFSGISYFDDPASESAAVNVARIQAKLDAGGTVIFTRSDNYVINANLEIPSNTHLILGSATITGATGSGDRRLITNSDWVGGNSNVRLSGGTVTTLETASTSRLVGFYNVRHLTVENMTLLNSEIHGIEVDDSFRVTLSDNTITGYGDDGITLHRCTRGVVTRNIISGGDCSGGGSHGVEIEDGNRWIQVTHNTIFDNIDGSGRFAGGILVDSNSSEPQEANHGITIAYNNVYNSSTNTSLNGITVNNDNAGDLSTNIRIYGNTITNAGRTAAIRVDGTRFVSVYDNTVVGNSSGGSYGIYFKDSDFFNIRDNNVSQSLKQGIYVDGDTCAEFNISANTVDSCGSAQALTDGIKVQATVARECYMTISSNAITNTLSVANMTKGININANIDYWTLEDNSVNVGGTAANAYVYTVPTHYTISNNTGGEAGDL